MNRRCRGDARTMATPPEKSGRIRDARGKSVTQIDPVRLHVMHRYDAIDAEALEAIVDEIEPGSARRLRWAYLIAPGCVVALAAFVGLLYAVSDAAARKDLVSTVTNPAIMAPNLVCCFVVPWIAIRQAHFKRIRSALLKHRRCPHCGYDLRGLPTAADRNTICPECGCAWLLDAEAIDAELAASFSTTVGGRSQRATIAVALGLALLCGLGLLAFMVYR